MHNLDMPPTFADSSIATGAMHRCRLWRLQLSLEGRRKTHTDPSHRQGGLPKAIRRSTEEALIIGRIGERVGRRSLTFYQAVGNRLAASGGRP